MNDRAIGPNEYRCEMCGEVFEFAWTDEEAQAERNEKGLGDVDCGVVCDDCYKKTPWGCDDESN